MAIECEFAAFMYVNNIGRRCALHKFNNSILDMRNKAAELGADAVETLDTGFDICWRFGQSKGIKMC